jgi:hypothetical protein
MNKFLIVNLVAIMSCWSFGHLASANEGVRGIPIVDASRTRAQVSLQNPSQDDFFCRNVGVKLQLRNRTFGEPVGTPQLDFKDRYIEARGKHVISIDLAELGVNPAEFVIHDVAISSLSCEAPSFKDYCKFAAHTSEDTFSIERILQENNARRCDDFNKEDQTRAAYRSQGIVSARPFAFLSNLKRLDLSGNKILDASPLARLKNLEVLRLARNPLVDVAGLNRLVVLEELDLASTAIVDISPIANLPRISTLDLRDSKVQKLGPLVKMPALKAACLAGTQVFDYHENRRRLDQLNSNCAW